MLFVLDRLLNYVKCNRTEEALGL